MFYKALLQQLTFYSWNRWYLLTYSFLSFSIPFINLSKVIDEASPTAAKAIKAIPQVETLASENLVLSPGITTPEYNGQHVLLFLFIAGLFVMVVRLIVQYVSYLNIKRKAKLLFTEGIKLYEVEENIVPFSFGTCKKFKNIEELNEILHHELVHVRQRHSIDILWAEVLCAFSWYNPFAWLIRHHIRQNLEFIADNKVLENGADKKQYQYLLLQVMGVPGPGIAVPFNFSSLKKRITMMNKLKSARLHLVKFLFVLPLLAVLLIAFRSKVEKNKADHENDFIIISGVVVQGDNYKPLQNAHYKVEGSQIEGNTDEKGYYTFFRTN